MTMCTQPLCRLASLSLLWACFVEGWSPAGHERIARVADHLLVGKHKDQIRTMMHSDLVDAADHEAKMTKQYPETNTLHFHRQDPEWTCDTKGGLGDRGHVRCDGHGASKGSLFCALAYFFEHFAHDALLKEYPEPEEPIGTPESLQALKDVPAKEQVPAQFLRWLVVLMGDMHQPLHWLHEHDYGRDIKVRYKEEEHTLLKFWEEYIPNHLKHKLETGTMPFMVDKDYEQHMKGWAHKVPTELFRGWAKEVAERVCGEVYHPMTVNHADGTRVENPFTLTDELFDKWVKLAEDLLQMSGERVGFVLNDILEHKRHKEAEKDGRALPSRKVATNIESKPKQASTKHSDGSGMYMPEPSKTVPRPGSPTFNVDDWVKQLKIEEKKRSRSAAMYNIFIAAILVPSLLFAYRWHEQIGGGSLIGFAKKRMM